MARLPIDTPNQTAELPLVHNDPVERVASAIEETMFAPHEFPLDRELHGKYRDTAREAIAAVAMEIRQIVFNALVTDPPVSQLEREK